MPAFIQSPFCITQRKLRCITLFARVGRWRIDRAWSSVLRGVRSPQDILGQGVGHLADRSYALPLQSARLTDVDAEYDRRSCYRRPQRRRSRDPTIRGFMLPLINRAGRTSTVSPPGSAAPDGVGSGGLEHARRAPGWVSQAISILAKVMFSGHAARVRYGLVTPVSVPIEAKSKEKPPPMTTRRRAFVMTIDVKQFV